MIFQLSIGRMRTWYEPYNSRCAEMKFERNVSTYAVRLSNINISETLKNIKKAYGSIAFYFSLIFFLKN